MHLTLPIVTGAAILDSINPCAISVLLLTIGFLISAKASRRHILLVSGLYIFGIFLTYISIGIGILSALSIFGIPHIMTKIGAILLIIYSLLSLAESLIPDFPIKLAIPQFIKPKLADLIKKASYISVFLLGVLVGLFEFPCTGGPYLFILGLLHDRSTVTLGSLYLIYYNIIFVSPLILILFISTSTKVTNKIDAFRHSHSKSASIITSLATLILGFVIFFL